tara:strand:- start:341 stop:553 length:213 start_codon:yes stop_codon:yes gene_type:complete
MVGLNKIKRNEIYIKKIFNSKRHKTLQPGSVMDVTQEYAQWLDENGYGDVKVKKEKKETKTKKVASDKEQ